MNNEKIKLINTVAMMSDRITENNFGYMFQDKISERKIFISKIDAKNSSRELDFIKSNVCQYGANVFDARAQVTSGEEKERNLKAKEFFSVASEKNVSAEKIYNTTKAITSKNKESQNENTL